MFNLQEGDNLTVLDVDEEHVVLVDDAGNKYSLDQPGVFFARVVWTVATCSRKSNARTTRLRRS